MLIAPLVSAFTGDGTAYTLGSVQSGNCNFMSSGFARAATDYAAINDAQWSGSLSCGRCASVRCVDARCRNSSASVIVQILDRCPECKFGDLDLSPSVFQSLTGSSPSRYAIEWQFASCPSDSGVLYCAKTGSNDYWLAVQPTGFTTGVASMRINDRAATPLDGAFYFVADRSQIYDLSKVAISLTDITGSVITDTVALTAGQCARGSAQFPSEPTYRIDYNGTDYIDC